MQQAQEQVKAAKGQKQAEQQHDLAAIRSLVDISKAGSQPAIRAIADYRKGITLQYIHDRVGANTVWMMPLFPNNDQYNLPDACDNLGSPYAVRDYFHIQGKLSRDCIAQGRDENSFEDSGSANPGTRVATPTPACYGNVSFDRVIQDAHRRGLKVMLDLAFNHFGHNYLFYDYASFTPVRERIAHGEDLNRLWDFGATFEQELVSPAIVDTEASMRAAPGMAQALRDVSDRCPNLKSDDLVRGAHLWREMLDGERTGFSCTAGMILEFQAPGFYLGQNHNPSQHLGDNFTNSWTDVKFLYLQEQQSHLHELVRNREYLFRVMNYWVSRGVDGFRLDHTTDGDSGINPNTWRYLVSKVNYYDWVRKGRPSNHIPPIYLAEEFHDQMGMNQVVDIMTEGYVGDMRGQSGATKNTSFVERVLESANRFNQHTYVMRALETHDEKRLTDGTGFTPWTGAGFWGVGAASPGTPMLLMGQEFGEGWGLGFRRSDFLRSRFVGTGNYREDGDALVDFYGKMNRARQDPFNRALGSWNRWNLRSRQDGQPDQRIFAQARWDVSNGMNVVFTFNNLWETPVQQSFFLPPELAGQLSLGEGTSYKLVDALTGSQVGPCHSGADLKTDFYVQMGAGQRLQWLRLELCDGSRR